MARPRRDLFVLGTLCLGAFLNPFNSSMLAVALVTLREQFELTIEGVTWVITAFYIASAVAQPLMGRLADRFGPRRMFVGGMLAVVVGSVMAALSPTWILVCVSRVVTAIGTATAFPSAVAIVRRQADRDDCSPTRPLARLQMASNLGSAAGPVTGGFLLAATDWRGIFIACVPVALGAALGSVAFIDRDPPRAREPWQAALAQSDVPGVVLFVAALGTGMAALLGALPSIVWLMILVSLVSSLAFVWRELHCPWPFLDIRLLVRNKALMRVYGTFVIFCIFYYAVSFGLPQYLEDSVGLTTTVVGAVMFPMAVTSAVINPLVSYSVDKCGVRVVVMVGIAMSMAAGAACYVSAQWNSVVAFGITTALVGVASGFVTVGSGQGMFDSARADQTGMAAGLLQTSRYVGAVSASAALALAFGHGADLAGWRTVLAMTVVALIVGLLVSRSWRPPTKEV